MYYKKYFFDSCNDQKRSQKCLKGVDNKLENVIFFHVNSRNFSASSIIFLIIYDLVQFSNLINGYEKGFILYYLWIILCLSSTKIKIYSCIFFIHHPTGQVIKNFPLEVYYSVFFTSNIIHYTPLYIICFQFIGRYLAQGGGCFIHAEINFVFFSGEKYCNSSRHSMNSTMF